MSYTLQFPPRPLPADVHSPPYAVFAIHGVPVSSTNFPLDVPIALITHFAPITKLWILPPPPEAAYLDRSLVHLKPFIGINIPYENITEAGLAFIVRRMLQLAGRPLTREHFESWSDIKLSVKVLQTWRALDLPASGMQSLEMHLQSRLMLGPPVCLNEIQALWTALPTSSPILSEMAHNFIRGFINDEYPRHEVRYINEWLDEEHSRKSFFLLFESAYNGQTVKDKSKGEGKKEGVGASVRASANSASEFIQQFLTKVDQQPNSRINEAAAKTRKARIDQQEMLREKAKLAMQNAKRDEATRLRRLASDDSMRSVETVLWNPEEGMAALKEVTVDELAPKEVALKEEKLMQRRLEERRSEDRTWKKRAKKEDTRRDDMPKMMDWDMGWGVDAGKPVTIGKSVGKKVREWLASEKAEMDPKSMEDEALCKELAELRAADHVKE